MSRAKITVSLSGTPNTLIDACLALNINYAKVYYRMMKLHMSFEDAVDAVRKKDSAKEAAKEPEKSTRA